MILKCIKTVATVAFAMVSINVAGQDLLARQAPIDRKLKAVDSLALVRQIKAEQAVYPAYSLYPTWENQRVHAYGNTVSVPDTFRIDLSGFCMPTTHTKITSKCISVIRSVLLLTDVYVWLSMNVADTESM